MEDAGRVGALERARDVACDDHEVPHRELAFTAARCGEDLVEPFAWHELHREVRHTPIATGLDDVDDVVVAQLRDGACLTFETRTRLGVRGDLGPEQLERDLAAERALLREVHRAHSAFAEARDQPVVRERFERHARALRHRRDEHIHELAQSQLRVAGEFRVLGEELVERWRVTAEQPIEELVFGQRPSLVHAREDTASSLGRAAGAGRSFALRPRLPCTSTVRAAVAGRRARRAQRRYQKR